MVTLVNAKGGAIGYGVREYGINLVWGGFRDNIRFERRAGPGEVAYDDAVAIFVVRGGYLRYQSREYGINLGWSSSPAYQWRIRGGTADSAVETTLSFALYNTVEPDYLIYCTRPVGINLRWQRDC